MSTHNPHDEALVHHRLSGRPGVRSSTTSAGGVITRSKAPAIPSLGDVRAIPLSVLDQVRDLLTDTPDHRPAPDALAQLRGVLREYL